MAKILDGKLVTSALKDKQRKDVEVLRKKNVIPTLGIIRVGSRQDDIVYERGATKRCESVGVVVKAMTLPENASQEELIELIQNVNADTNIHGVLLFRPLPKHMNDYAVRNALVPEKDIDGIGDISMTGVFTGTDSGFAPCTAQACIEILDFFGYELTGKKAVVIGRSLVVGKPLAMMLLARNATVTICHTKTPDIPSICRAADVIIVAAGQAKAIGKDYFSPGQFVIDVGINLDEDGKLCGDVDFDSAEPVVEAITPVPGGVGTVTTSVLVDHVIAAAKRL